MRIVKRTYSCGTGVYELPKGGIDYRSDAATNGDNIHRSTEKHTLYVLIDQGRRVDGFLTQWAANRALKGLPRIPRPLPRYKRQHTPANTRLLSAPQCFRLTGDGEHFEKAKRQHFWSEKDKAIALCEARYLDWLAENAIDARLAA